LYGNDNIHNEAHAILHFLNAEIVCSVDNYQPSHPPPPYNALNVIRDLYCCKQTVYRVSESVS